VQFKFELEDRIVGTVYSRLYLRYKIIETVVLVIDPSI